jgi:transcriptional regulator with XRE-family HTH domain
MYILWVMHLSDYMAQKGLSDQTVATAIRRSRVTVSRIRRRKVRPDWPTIEALREWSGGAVTADDFMQIDGAQ